jgi:hypothetical protein
MSYQERRTVRELIIKMTGTIDAQMNAEGDGLERPKYLLEGLSDEDLVKVICFLESFE